MNLIFAFFAKFRFQKSSVFLFQYADMIFHVLIAYCSSVERECTK